MQRQKRILAVDDNPINLTILQALLCDYTFRTAASGAEALDIASSFRPDVVLLDIMMPGIDGYETCRQIREISCLRHTKIIMLSAKTSLTERLAGYEAGADDYVTKPFDSDELLAKVRVYLKLKSIEEIEEVKNRMIEVLQHSNRTPLNNIISYAELLTGTVDLDDETRDLAPKVILRHARRLQQLLEKSEMLASMKSEQLLFDFQQGDICEVIRNVTKELVPKCAEFNVQIEASIPPSIEARFDHGNMHFAIRALLDNGIRFSQPGGIITVELVELDRQLTLTVADQGEGIPEDLLRRVFEPFGNPDSPLFNRGDGLSLAIVEQIAWAHDGIIWAESQLGQGAKFSIRFPDAAVNRKHACDKAFCGYPEVQQI